MVDLSFKSEIFEDVYDVLYLILLWYNPNQCGAYHLVYIHCASRILSYRTGARRPRKIQIYQVESYKVLQRHF